MGRNRGIGVTLINQRAATVNKDVLTQLDTLLAFQNTSPQDRKALADWVEYHAAEGDFDKFMQSLPSLERGKGWIWSPEFMNVFEKIEIRKRETFHPDREKIGDNFVMPQLDKADIQNFITDFKKTPIKKEKKGMEKEVVIEQPKLSAEILALRNQYESQLMEKDIEIRKRDDLISQIRKLVGGSEVGTTSVNPMQTGNVSMWLEKLGNGGDARILKFLAEKSGLKFTRSQIGLAVGLQSSSGSFSTYLSTLRRNSLILKEGQEFRINPNL